MREDVLKSFLTFDLTFFNTFRNGEIISRMTNDLQSAKSAVSGNIILLIRNCCLTVFNIVILFALSWKVTLAIIAPMPLYTIITTVHTKLGKKFEKLG
jgi:subfamily B ATP-binding cassette protein MsbA